MESVRKRFDKKNESQHPVVTEQDIAEVVSAWTKIPVQKLEESDTQRLSKLEKELHKRVIGQDEAVCAVARAVKRGRTGLKDPKGRLAHFCFWDLQVLEKQNCPRLLQRLCLEMKIL